MDPPLSLGLPALFVERHPVAKLPEIKHFLAPEIVIFIFFSGQKIRTRF